MSPGVVVVIPARNEQGGIAASLRDVCGSLDLARERGLVARCTVEVVAHRCTDETADRASAVLSRCDGRVTTDEGSETVGAVRDTGARRALARLARAPSATWLLSTDADTVVGVEWVSRILTAAARTETVGVVGLAALDRWRGTERGAAAYQRLLRAKMLGGLLHQHDHVYGANLAVRADAYLDVGGFPHAGHGEDQRLVDTLTDRGHRLLRTRAIGVVTSGRLRGRAAGGLAHRLSHLDSSAGDPGVA